MAKIDELCFDVKVIFNENGKSFDNLMCDIVNTFLVRDMVNTFQNDIYYDSTVYHFNTNWGGNDS